VTVTDTRRRTTWPADLALVAAVLMAGSVSRHAVYTAFGVTLLIACVLALAVALWQGAARVAPSRPAVLAALALAVVGQVIKPPYMNVVDRNAMLRAGTAAARPRAR